jgi:ATP-dependent Clp protease, protease subunit
MDLSNKIFLFGGFYPENVEKTIKDLMSKFDSGQRSLELYIMSDGGYLTSFFGLKDVIEEYGKKGLEVVSVAVGAAQSAGALLLMSTNKAFASKNTEIMIHGAQGGMFGDAEAMRSYLKLMDKMNGKIAEIVTKKTGISQNEALELIKKDRSFTADEAVKYGFIDGIWNVEETASELSRYISENMAASASPTNEIADAMKFVNSVKLPVKLNKEENMADGKDFALELQAVQTVNKDLSAKVTELTNSLAKATEELKNSEKYKVEFYKKEKEKLIAKSKSLISQDVAKQNEFEAKLRKFIDLDYEKFEDLTNELVGANTNSVPTGLVIDTKVADDKRKSAEDEKKKLENLKKEHPEMSEEDLRAAIVINAGLEATSKNVDMTYAKSCVGIKGGN